MTDDSMYRIRPVARDVPMVLSCAQRRIWSLEQRRPGSTEQLTSVALRLSGPLDHAALRAALDGVVADHETLRTRCAAVDGEPVGLLTPCGPVPVRYVDMRSVPVADRGLEMVEHVSGDRFAVDLGAGPVFVATLLAVDATEHVLALTTHDIATDGWSEGLILRELMQRYTAGGTGPNLDAARVRYADFAAWQRRRMAVAGERPLTYWREQLAGLAPLVLPTDRPRPPVRDASGAALPFTVPAPVADALRALARGRRATPFMVALAAFQVLLTRYCEDDDVAVGVPVIGRERPELWDVVGLFRNTLVLRTDLSGAPSFTEAVDRARATLLGAFDHQELPFDHLVEALGLDLDPSYNPLFSAMIVWNDAVTSVTSTGGLTVQRVPVGESTAPVDLTVSLAERPDSSLNGAVVFATALFDRASAQSIADQYVRLLTVATAAPHTPVAELAGLIPS